MKQHRINVPVLIALLFCLAVSMQASSAASSTEYRASKGQTVYVPVYSNIFSGPKKLPYQLAATLSIRNTDPSASLRLTAIDYYDTGGKLVRRHIENPFVLGPLASTYVHVGEKDTTGGFGANFIVKWHSERVINTPIIECVMIGATSGLGISFVSQGQEIRESP